MKLLGYQSLFFALCAFPLLLTGQTAGTPDPDFGQGGEVVIKDSIKTYYGGYRVVLPDGKMIVGGNEYGPNGEHSVILLTRLLPDGTVDPSYGINGQVRPTINNGFDGGINKIALTANGQLILAGNIVTDTSSAAFVARLDAEGELDLGFGQNGLAIFDIGDDEDDFSSILIKPDGNILLGGLTYDSGNPGYYDFLLVQLLPDGSPDPGFGTAGIATADFASGIEGIISLALQADGKIVAAGVKVVTSYDMEIVRFLPDGTIDQSFGNNGVFIYGPGTRDEVAYDVVIQEDQKIALCGASFQNGTPLGEITLFRLHPDGSFDPTFGTNGQVFTDIGFGDFARALVLQPDGKILVGAASTDSSNTFDESRFWVLRYNTDGSLDTTFGDGGKVRTPTYKQFTETTSLLLQADGKIIHTGTGNNQMVLWRYSNDIMVNVQETPLTDFHLQCSPNPIAENTNLSWTLATSAEVRCDLYDAQGRLLQNVIPSAFFPAGNHQQMIYFTSDILVGTYFLVLQVDKQQQVISLIK